MENEEKENLPVSSGEEIGVVERSESSLNVGTVMENAPEEQESSAPEVMTEMGTSFMSSEATKMEDDLPEGIKKEPKPIISKGKKILLLIFGLIVLSAAAFAAYTYYKEQTAQVVVNEDQGTIVKSSVEAMKSVKTYNYKGKMDFSFDSKESDSQNQARTEKAGFSFTHEGVMDGNNPESPNMYSALIFDGSYNAPEGSGDGKLNMEMVLLDKIFYVKLNDIGSNGNNADFSDIMKQAEGFLEIIKNNWYFISMEDLKDSGNLAATGEVSEDKISEEDIKKISNIIGSYDLMQFSKDLGDEKVGDIDTYHYQVRVDGREGFDMVMELIKESLVMQGAEEEAKSFEDSMKEQVDDINKTKEMIDFVMNEVNTEVWIGKNDSLVYRVKIDGNLDKDFMKAYEEKYQTVYGVDTNGDGENNADGTAEVTFDFNLDYTLSNFNTAAVRKPENAKDLKKIIESFEAQVTNSWDMVDTDFDGLSDSQETFYGSDPKKSDTDGDGYKDGNEVDNGYDPIVAGSAKLNYTKLYNL